MKPWKQLVVFHLIPIAIAVVSIPTMYVFLRNFFDTTGPKAPAIFPNYIDNLHNSAWYEEHFLVDQNNQPEIYILGSSELTGGTEATPYNFITDHFTTRMTGIGHAGNQCFSIYSQLLANRNRLKANEIVIVLSPGWFYGPAARGTSPSVFLEYNSKDFISEVSHVSKEDEFTANYAKRISDCYGDFVNADMHVKMLHFRSESERSIMHKALYSPLIELNKSFDSDRHKMYHASQIQIRPDSVTINWDSLFHLSREEHLKSSANNSWYINSAYYDLYVKGKTSKIHLIPEEHNQELEDFRMLVKLLKKYECDASFIIMPLNPFFYSNLKELDPLILTIEDKLKHNAFPCLNMWCSDPVTFDKALLTDVMHLSKYGWYKADKFIVETYHLNK